MRSHAHQAIFAAAGITAGLLLSAGHARAATVNLTAKAATATLPDGQMVPMWGLFCDRHCSVTTATACVADSNCPDGETCETAVTDATCTDLKGDLQAGGSTWQPPLIRVSTGSLTIHLTNALPNPVPTSLVIVGQLGGGLGHPIKVDSPEHAIQGTTWPGAGDTSDPGAVFTPPKQPQRIQSFGHEVAHNMNLDLAWSALKPGTYLLESGTHPSIQGPMGLYGVVIVEPAAGTAYPSVNYDKDVPLLLSEIDPRQNAAVSAAVNTPGFSETGVRALRDFVSSVTVVDGGSGYSGSETVSIAGGGGAGATASLTVDSGVITGVTVTDGGNGYTSIPTAVISGPAHGADLVVNLSLAGVALCSDGAPACYPAVVNYDPRYYLINGLAFDKTNPGASTFEAHGGSGTSLLVRLVNAGVRMHVPSVVGLDMALIAEDGNVLPGLPRTQNEVFMAAGKTYDVMLTLPSALAKVAYPVFDRQLSLSTNNQRDGGMQGYIGVNAGSAPVGGVSVTALPDSYFLVPNKTLVVSDPAKGVLWNDTNVYGVTLGTAPASAVKECSGTTDVCATNGDCDPGVTCVTRFKLNADGTFFYKPSAGTLSDSFTYLANGAGSGILVTLAECELAMYCSNDKTASCSVDADCGASNTCDVGNGCRGGAPTANDDLYNKLTIASFMQATAPGVLSNDTDPHHHALKAVLDDVGDCATVSLSEDGSFSATPGTIGTPCSFTYHAVNSQDTASAAATVTLNFPTPSHLAVSVIDGRPDADGDGPIERGFAITDYRWIIEEDLTFVNDPNAVPSVGHCSVAVGTSCFVDTDCPSLQTCDGYAPVPNFGANFHTSHMPVVAVGCLGDSSCGSGQTILGSEVGTLTPIDPGDVHLDPGKRYYISILPGDGQNPVLSGAGGPVDVGDGNLRPFDVDKDCQSASDFVAGTGTCGHGMGGATIAAGQSSVTVKLSELPAPTAKLSVFVFEDDDPLNGEVDAGGGVDILATKEPGLGSFNIILTDQAGMLGDPAGDATYDATNMPLSNSLAGTIDPVTGLDACPISNYATVPDSGTCSVAGTTCTKNTDCPGGETCDGTTKDKIVGQIVTCPKYESDGHTLSPLAGQALIDTLYPGLFEVTATPGADRVARGEEWIQTNTLDGTKPHEAFLMLGEPSYFQEFGPGGFHVSIGFANPAKINSRLPAGGTAHVQGKVALARTSRTPDMRIFSSATYDALGFTQCFVSLGDVGGADFAFTTCDAEGKFEFFNVPVNTGGKNYRITIFDQWNDIIVDGLSLPLAVTGDTDPDNIPVYSMMQWRTNLATRTFIDVNKDGVSQVDEPGLPLLATNVRYRDGSYMGFNNTDLDGYAGYNEIFPFFNWMVVEADTARYKQTGVHVAYDAGGPADQAGGGTSTLAAFVANTSEAIGVPELLRVPGAVYCSDGDCTGTTIQDPVTGASGPNPGSTARIDPPWVTSEAWQGFAGQTQFFEFGKTPFAENENGGIEGHVVYSSTRPFDDPSLLLQLSWEPLIPRVPINLYRVGVAPDGTESLTLVDHTTTSSWDDWAQGFRSDGIPNMNCPGQDSTSPFFYTLRNSRQWLNPGVELPNNSQFKCYDGMAMYNQAQPAPYDGKYKFPSVVDRDPATGVVVATNCKSCVPNPAELTCASVSGSAVQGSKCTTNDDCGTTGVCGHTCAAVTDGVTANHACTTNDDCGATGGVCGTPMLPPGNYVVESVLPPGYETVKEEDKNILLGDVLVAPVVSQFAGLGNVFIMPDQAEVNEEYDPSSPQNQTANEGVVPRHEGDTGSVEVFWPCVGTSRVVPDFLSEFPLAAQISPFAGATRNLCDRKLVTLEDQSTVLAKFFAFSTPHIAGHYTGLITDDFASEFNPFSPSYGEKFAVPNLPISFRDHTGVEIGRTYSDQWGAYNGMHYTSWSVNPPNPSGFAPSMAISCMNDPGPILDTREGSPTQGQMITDPLYDPGYSQFCYESPRMPGQTQYMDTPVVPTMAFAEGYTPPDCAYPDYTPAIRRVEGDVLGGGGRGPWVSAAGHTLTITALGQAPVPNPQYMGPHATGIYGQKFITRHFDFGASQGTGSVTIGGVAASVNSWSESAIVVDVPAGVPNCAIQQVGNTTQQCGELVIKTDNGKTSIDTVTVTIGGNTPTYVTGENPSNTALQQAIDAAPPGELIIVGPGTYREMLLMWKPVRLQGVGAASTTIFADAHPAGKLDPWRRRVLCLFGLALNGQPISGSNPYDSSPDPFTCSPDMHFKVDRIPMEGIVGWDTTVNGNLAELLQEPTLMGAFEGAGITVLGKGVHYPDGVDPWGTGAEAAFPADTRLLTNGVVEGHDDCAENPSNFLCNPSRIDGLSITDSSQGGGGIYVHGWNHHLEISNNRVYANAGTLAGGISVGQGEFGDPNIDNANDVSPPLSPDVLQRPEICGGIGLLPTTKCPTGTQLPYWLQADVYVHHNSVTQNASYGDGLYSYTPGAAGGISIATGSDNYKVQYNWVCGNLSTGDGGGIGHIGFSYNGDISHNQVVFNQSANPSMPTHGGGILVEGAGPDGSSPQCANANGVGTGGACSSNTDCTSTVCQDGTRDGELCAADGDCPGGTCVAETCQLLECGTVTDVDCPPGLTEGSGPDIVLDGNLIQGNSAESGSGGGIRLQLINGSEVSAFPLAPTRWYGVTVKNNIIVNNVAGWDGGGISMQDALRTTIVNNSILDNDTTASAGVLFGSFVANSGLGSVPVPSIGSTTGPCDTPSDGCVASLRQPAGLVTMGNTTNLSDSLAFLAVNCPGGYSGADCKNVSLPVLTNNVFWGNRAFHIEMAPPSGSGLQGQQSSIQLHPTLNQSTTGQCVSPSPDQYWDLGVRGDSSPTSHPTYTLDPQFSILSAIAGYAATNYALDPAVASAYCNGSRVPPEPGTAGYNVPPGVAQENIPNPVFNLTAAATVDEANNWVNLSYGPLSLLGSYVPADSSSPTINKVSVSDGSAYALAPSVDFFGYPRKSNAKVDIGAVEFQGADPCDHAAVVDFDSTPMKYHVNTGPIDNVIVQQHAAMKYQANTASDESVLVQFGSSMRYQRNAGATGVDATWMTEGFADGAWSAGTYGVGYDATTVPNALALINTSVSATGTTSVYTRATFTIGDPTTVRSLLFGADYDDGYVVWINGIEVARASMPAGAPAGDTAATSHESSNGATPNYGTLITLPPAALAAIHGGTNVLAVGVWNTALPSSDMVLVPRLSVVYDWTKPAFDDTAWAAGSYGVGYDTAGAPNALALIDTTVPSTSASVYTRATFTLSDVASITAVRFGADFDDGYVAYINGHEVARSSIPAGTPNWNTAATSHESSNGTTPNYGTLVDITAAATPWLVNGSNVLALGVWNTTLPSSDLVVVPRLSFERNWTAESFDDSTWSSGTYGVGYDTGSPNALALIKTAVPTGTGSVYTRAQFNITSMADVTSILLGVDYDDGYVAYVNGHEVSRGNMNPGVPSWNTPAATNTHESSNGAAPNYGTPVNVYAAALPYLHTGINTFAIGVWNNPAGPGSSSSDLVLVPQLVLGKAEVCGNGLDDDCDGSTDEAACIPPGGPVATLSTSSIGFGAIALNTLSPVQDLTLGNSGTADLTVNEPDFTATPGFVRVDPNSGTPCGTGATFVVPAGGSCAVGIEFAPTASTGGEIDYSSVLAINSNSMMGVENVTLTGSAASAPAFCVTAPEGSACDDGNAATCADACHDGACEGTSVPTPVEVGGTLRVDRSGTDSTVTWDGEEGVFNLYRGTVPAGESFSYNQGCLNPEASIVGGSAADDAVPAPGELFFYLVTRTEMCRESIAGHASDGSVIPNNNTCPSR